MEANELKRPTILLVDDNPDIQTVISLSLEHYGYSVVGAANGEEAISLLSNCQPTVAIIDYRLPDINGIAVGEKIRMLERGDSRMLMILFSGSHDPKIQQQADAAGFDAYIIKPIRVNSLLEQIKRLESEKVN